MKKYIIFLVSLFVISLAITINGYAQKPLKPGKPNPVTLPSKYKPTDKQKAQFAKQKSQLDALKNRQNSKKLEKYNSDKATRATLDARKKSLAEQENDLRKQYHALQQSQIKEKANKIRKPAGRKIKKQSTVR